MEYQRLRSKGITVKQTITVAITTAQPNEQHVLLLQRKTEPFLHAWEMIGGYVERDEEPVMSAIRETLEETGIVIDGACCHLLEISPFECNGEPAQNWLYHCEVPCALQVVLSPEHEAAEWKPVREVLEMDLAYKHAQHLRTVLEAR